MHRRLNRARQRLGGSLWAPIFLAVLVVGLSFLLVQSYLSRVDSNDSRYHECLATTEIRWVSVDKNRTDAKRESILAGRTSGLIARVHLESADGAANLANTTESFTAPTKERREAYCLRLNPKPSIFG